MLAYNYTHATLRLAVGICLFPQHARTRIETLCVRDCCCCRELFFKSPLDCQIEFTKTFLFSLTLNRHMGESWNSISTLPPTTQLYMMKSEIFQGTRSSLIDFAVSQFAQQSTHNTVTRKNKTEILQFTILSASSPWMKTGWEGSQKLFNCGWISSTQLRHSMTFCGKDMPRMHDFRLISSNSSSRLSPKYCISSGEMRSKLGLNAAVDGLSL